MADLERRTVLLDLDLEAFERDLEAAEAAFAETAERLEAAPPLALEAASFDEEAQAIAPATRALDEHSAALAALAEGGGEANAIVESSAALFDQSAVTIDATNQALAETEGIARDAARGLEDVGFAGQDMGQIVGGALDRIIVQGRSAADVFSSLGRTLLNSVLSDVVVPAVTAPIANILTRAEGGPVEAGRPVLVGEEGPELFLPRSAGRIVPNDALVQPARPMTINIDARGAEAGVESRIRRAILEAAPFLVRAAIAGVGDRETRGRSLTRP